MKRHLPVLLMLVCAAALALGLLRLFELRYSVGDVYPPYSSLRSDPLGTMALYESLEKVPGVTTRREYRLLNQWPDGRSTTLLLLAVHSYHWDWMSEDSFKKLDQFVRNGGRLVITFFPQTTRGLADENDEAAGSSGTDTPQKRPADRMVPTRGDRSERAEAERGGVWLSERWGFDTAFRQLVPSGQVYQPVQVTNVTRMHLPQVLNWHSGVVLIHLASPWHTIYARDSNAVLAERGLGRGSVVLATDSYVVSNEAMARDRHADLLAWLIGSHSQVVFDEAHFGIVAHPGIAVLMRQYRLHGLVAGLMLLAGLFIWKSATGLVPPDLHEKQPGQILGKDATTGFVNLLRRWVAPGDLLEVCFTEWKRSAALTGCSTRKLRELEAVFQTECARPAKERHPLRAYQALCAAVRARSVESQSSPPQPQPQPRS